MKVSKRFAFCIGAAVVLLSGCGLRQAGEDATPAMRLADNATSVSGATNTKTFNYTGSEQTFVVPAGVTRLTVVARGGIGGGGSAPPSYAPPGFPGRVYAVIRVHGDEKLYVFVGASGKDGGYNGGGAGGKSGYGGGRGNTGGGASDVRVGGDALKNRIIVAAGGGGSGSAFYYCYAWGGDGGGVTGANGGSDSNGVSGHGGSGATQSQGGSGGAGGTGSNGNGHAGSNGSLGAGGKGGDGGPPKSAYDYGLPGGGGGGGYYGGGGGGGSGTSLDGQGGGGGGGSSYVEPSAFESKMWKGWRYSGDGRVSFSW